MLGVPEPAYVEARRVLLDVLDGLDAHLDAIVVVGAQAVYLRVGEGTGPELALAPYTTDADLVVDPARTPDQPDLTTTLQGLGLVADDGQPGVWWANDVEVDLMIPDLVAGGGRRGADLGVHGRKVARRARGLEGALIDNDALTVRSLDEADPRAVAVRVAGCGALLVAKMHKIADRRDDERRSSDKDALDVYRILRSTSTSVLASGIGMLLHNDVSQVVTREAIEHLRGLFALPDLLGSRMAARAADPLLDPEEIAASVAVLTQDLLDAISLT
jgi:hypothetical protein